MTNIKIDQIKHKRFIKSAQYRTNQVLKKINTLGHCSNINYYQYLPHEIDNIFNTIIGKLNYEKSKFIFPSDDEIKLT